MNWWNRHFAGSTRGRIVALLGRDASTVEDLARELGLTDNAVRAQLAQLEREGVVAPTGLRRTGVAGKPATIYGIPPRAAAMFSSAYAPVLASLLIELGDQVPVSRVESVLRGAGRRLAPRLAAGTTFAERVRAAAAFLADLGADADVVETPEGFMIRGHGCVLSEAVAACPATCQAVEALLSEVTGAQVREQCDRAGAPRCRFAISPTV